MKQKRLTTLQDRLVDYVRSRHERIQVQPKQGLFNYKCFFNATQYAMTHKDHTVVEVIYIEYGTPILHYINKNMKTGEYLETTLGYRASNLEYYLIREVPEFCEANMNHVFNTSLDAWTHQFTNWFDRVILRIDRLT